MQTSADARLLKLENGNFYIKSNNSTKRKVIKLLEFDIFRDRSISNKIELNSFFFDSIQLLEFFECLQLKNHPY